MDEFERRLRIVEILNAIMIECNIEISEFRTAMRAASGNDIIDIMPQIFAEIAKGAIKIDTANWFERIRGLLAYAEGKRDEIPQSRRVPDSYWNEYRHHCRRLLKQWGEHHKGRQK